MWPANDNDVSLLLRSAFTLNLIYRQLFTYFLLWTVSSVFK